MSTDLGSKKKFTRRTIVKGAAWSVPVIAAAAAVPAHASSANSCVQAGDLTLTSLNHCAATGMYGQYCSSPGIENETMSAWLVGTTGTIDYVASYVYSGPAMTAQDLSINIVVGDPSVLSVTGWSVEGPSGWTPTPDGVTYTNVPLVTGQTITVRYTISVSGTLGSATGGSTSDMHIGYVASSCGTELAYGDYNSYGESGSGYYVMTQSELDQRGWVEGSISPCATQTCP